MTERDSGVSGYQVTIPSGLNSAAFCAKEHGWDFVLVQAQCSTLVSTVSFMLQQTSPKNSGSVLEFVLPDETKVMKEEYQKLVSHGCGGTHL